MKKTPKTIFIFLLVIFLFLFILLPVISFFAIFHDTWLSDEFKQRRAEISAEKYEEQAIEDATSYLEDHFENLDEDDIVDVMWAPHAPNVWGIDGVALIIENKGESFFFTVYTEKDDLEFEVVVDTAQKKNTYDTYADNLFRRDVIMTYMQLYEPISGQCEKIILNGDWRDFYKTYEDNTQNDYDLMMDDLYMLLSCVQDTRPLFDYGTNAGLISNQRTMDSFDIEFYVDENVLDYCKANLDFLTRLSVEYTIMDDECSELKATYLSVKILTKDGCEIQFFPSGLISIWDDSQEGYAYNEDITEFVKRDTYMSSQSATNESSS